MRQQGFRGAPDPSLIVSLEQEKAQAASTPWWQSRWYVAILVLLSVLPLLWPPLPPLTDLPGHIGRYSVMLSHGSAPLSRWYHFQWHLVGNLGTDLIVWALAPKLGLLPTVKGVAVAIPVLTVASTIWFAKEVHGRIPPTIAFSLPLAFNQYLFFGFLNYVLSMAIALGGYALWLRLGRRDPKIGKSGIMVAIGLSAWVTHVFGWASLGLMVFAGECGRARDEGVGCRRAVLRGILQCVPLMPPVLLMLIWRSSDGGDTYGFLALGVKAAALLASLRDRWEWWDCSSIMVIGALILAGMRGKQFAMARTAAYPAAALAVALLLLPAWLFGSALADVRAAPYVLLLATIAAAPATSVSYRDAAGLAMLGLLFFVARVASNTASAILAAHDVSRELEALDHIPQGTRIVSLVGVCDDRDWYTPRLRHIGGMALASRDAFSNEQWRMSGAPLMTITNKAAGAFAADPSQMLDCVDGSIAASRRKAFAALPRSAFDYLWLIRAADRTLPEPVGTTLVWRNDTSALYKINHRPVGIATARGLV